MGLWRGEAHCTMSNVVLEHATSKGHLVHANGLSDHRDCSTTCSQGKVQVSTHKVTVAMRGM